MKNKDVNKMKKALPLGVSDYREMKLNGYYVADKSLIMRDFLSDKTKVTLITRPRRFGKTLNMSMMAAFFDITKDSREIFKDTKIMKTEYADEINQYPTIFLSLADAKGDKKSIVEIIKSNLLEQYSKYEYVFKDMNRYEQVTHDGILDHLSQYYNENLDGIANAIVFLMRMMEKYYHKKVMVFIDEYDTPFIEAHVNNYYNDIRSPLSSLLHNALKTSSSLQYAMLTGVQRVAKENIFSDLNNLVVYTVMDNRYSEYFGFTSDEVSALLDYYGLKLNKSVQKMYDGYHIGNSELYNPWSIVNYASSGKLKPYWVNVSSNAMIRKAMEKRKRDFDDGYEKLIKTGSVETYVVMETSFFELSSTGSLWGLFVNAGYLTVSRVISEKMNWCTLRIPNDEVRTDFISLTSC